jgi:hypothetical protein
MNDPTQMINRGFGMWLPPPMGPPVPAPLVLEDPNPLSFQPPRPAFTDKRKINWKGMKSGSDKSGGFKAPAFPDLQYQNRVKPRRFYPKKKNSYTQQHARFAPFAPRNTTSFIIRSKKSGGITSLVSPCPVTPAVLPTPKFSPSHEVLVDMAKEEWGVDGYGSMSGLIRLRSNPENENEEIEEDGSSGSDLEEHVEVERRLDHDLSRFEMVYPGDGLPGPGEEREGGHVARLEEENILLKDRLYYMEREMRELRRRLQVLEATHRVNQFGDVDQNYGEGENNQEENSINGNVEAEAKAISEENGGGIVCSEKSVGDCATPVCD